MFLANQDSGMTFQDFEDCYDISQSDYRKMRQVTSSKLT